MLLWFRKPPTAEREMAEKLYGAIVAQSRDPVFYAEMAVPDTVDGRFDMILLHCFLVMRRLRDGGVATQALSQTMYDVMFVDMDRSCREMGIGDMSVGKHVRRMMRAFNGRVAAYDQAIGDRVMLVEALKRNVYGSVKGAVPDDAVVRLADYMAGVAARMQGMPLEVITVAGIMPWSDSGRIAA